MDSAQALKETADLTDTFFVELARICARHKMAPGDLLVVMQKESGVTPSAINWAKNKDGSRSPVAIGLIQFTQVTLPTLGLTKEQWESLWSWTAEDQLPFVDKYFASVAHLRKSAPYENATQVYQAVFAPATMQNGSGPDTVLYRAPSKAYEQNAGLDFDKKGWIQLSDLTRFLRGAIGSSRVKACIFRMVDLGLDPLDNDASFFFAAPRADDKATETVFAKGKSVSLGGIALVALGAALTYFGDDIAETLEDLGLERSARFFRGL